MAGRDTLETVLIIAGSDSSGGAGLQRDLRVLADHQVEARVAVTAVTAQSDDRVYTVHPVPPPVIAEQLRAAAQSQIAAIKIGMLGGPQAVEAVVRGLEEFAPVPIVVDPVLASSSGSSLLSEDGRDALVKRLCPMASLLTPNLPEAALLLGEAPAGDALALGDQARRLSELCGCAVLLKGGHATDDEVTDHLVDGDTATAIEGRRIAATMRGTGCALSTAIAIYLGRGSSLVQACRAAKRQVELLMVAQAGPARR